jgi:AcrR family transcriptional regulator
VRRAATIADPTRDKILRAAEQLFTECGYEATTVREICAAAGANVAAISYYFGDKLELYTQVLRRSVKQASDTLKGSASAIEDTKEQKVRNLVRFIMDRLCRADRLDSHFRMMIHESVNPSPAAAHVIDEVYRPAYDELRDLIAEMIGLDSDHDVTRLCTHSIFGQIGHYAQSRAAITQLWPEMKMTAEQVEMIANHIADFSLAYIASAARKRSTSRNGSKPRNMIPKKQPGAFSRSHRRAVTKSS